MSRPRLACLAVTVAAGLVVAATSPASAVSMRNMKLKAHLDEYPPVPPAWGYSACWSYIHSDGREYAVLGARDGTAIYNVTNPASTYRVGFIPGIASIWREMKSYRDWIYVVTEGTGSGEGLQIIRMTDPEQPVLAATYAVNFHRSHTVSVDTSRALLICNGTRVNSGNFSAYYPSGIRILSLANPEAPVELSTWPNVQPEPDSQYVHDSVPVGNRLYVSSVYPGIVRVFDIANPAAPTEIAKWTYPGGFTHNSWPDATGNWLYVTDEIGGEPLKVFDISNLSQPVLVNRITSNPQAIVHNAHVRGAELYLANYTEGIRLLDITDPAHPAEFAWADSYGACSGGYNGVWDVCPFFPSGTVIASDMNTGLYVYRPMRNYGLLRVKVVDAATLQPLQGIKVFLDAQVESLTTTADGFVAFAPDPGAHTVLARTFGYADGAANPVVMQGGTVTVTLALAARPVSGFSGTVTAAGGSTPLEEADVFLAYGPLHEHSDAAGQFALADVPDGLHRVEVRRPGRIPIEFDRLLGPGATTQNFQLVATVVWDDLETGVGWTVGATGDDSYVGAWVRVDPFGSGPPGASAPASATQAPWSASAFTERGPARFDAQHEGFPAPTGPIQPEFDRSPPPGTMCFVTGQGASPTTPYHEHDVDGGRTTLTSPLLDATGMAMPTIGYWRWFYTNISECHDWLAVSISNNDGATWVPVDTTRGRHNHWEERAIRVADYVTPTNQVRVRFQAADYGNETIVEAAIDDLTLYDAVVPVDSGPALASPRLAFRSPWPNPARGTVRLTLDLPAAASVEAEILDLQGRLVAPLFRGRSAAGAIVMVWNGTDRGGKPAPAGVYLARARAGGSEAVVHIVTMP